MSERNDMVLYPPHWPKMHNGSNVPCDMLHGPCACGGWHDFNYWQDRFSRDRSVAAKTENEKLTAENRGLREERLEFATAMLTLAEFAQSKGVFILDGSKELVRKAKALTAANAADEK